MQGTSEIDAVSSQATPLVVEVEQSITLTISDEPNLEERLRQCFRLLGCELPHPLGFDVGQVVLKSSKPEKWRLQGNQTAEKLDSPATPEQEAKSLILGSY